MYNSHQVVRWNGERVEGCEVCTSIEECDFDRALEAQDLRGTLEEGVLKMFRGSLVVLKSIRRNNLYYLKGCAVIGNLTASEYLDDDSIRL